MGAIAYRIKRDESCVSASSTDIVISNLPSGKLHFLAVKQTSGTLAGFTVKVLPGDVASGDEEFYEYLMATGTVAALSATFQLRSEYGRPYVLSSGSYADRTGGLTIRITPAGTGTKLFTVAVLTEGAGGS